VTTPHWKTTVLKAMFLLYNVRELDIQSLVSGIASGSHGKDQQKHR
jgi:hypothetical protein